MQIRTVDPKVFSIQADTQVVSTLPYPIQRGSHFHIEGNGTKRYTHSLFAFPAKFHAPIVQWAINNYASPGFLIVDPYNGSGTMQVEALAAGYSTIGIDIDMVSNYIAATKTLPLNPEVLRQGLTRIRTAMQQYRRSAQEYNERQYPTNDISEAQYAEQMIGLKEPALLNIRHWFRKYVIVDLANLNQVIQVRQMSANELRFFRAIFAAIIRRCSNADPVTISQLE